MSSRTSKTKMNARGNVEMAIMAERALTENGFIESPGMCQAFVRQVVQHLYGSRYNRYHRGSANLSARAWKRSPYVVNPERGALAGDIYYKFGTANQPDGHVGIRIYGNKIAENSTEHSGRNGARGVRSLQEFGKPDLIIRLPR